MHECGPFMQNIRYFVLTYTSIVNQNISKQIAIKAISVKKIIVSDGHL